MTNCIFCELKNDWIYENEDFYSIFDIHPVSPGHALVIPKKHTVSLLDLDENEWAMLRTAIRQTINIIEAADLKKLYKDMKKQKKSDGSPKFCEKMLRHKNIGKKPDGYNIGNNEGVAAGRTIHHLHLQIIPRYRGDVKNPIGGIRTIFTELGDYTKQEISNKKIKKDNKHKSQVFLKKNT